MVRLCHSPALPSALLPFCPSLPLSGGAGEEVLECYEAAAALSPGSLPSGEALFFAYVRCNKPVQQQMCALKLYKRSGQERHLLWAVCSLLLQLPLTSNLVKLAEGLLARHWLRGKVEAAEALRVHLDVLHRLGKHGELREVVEGPAGDLLTMTAERLRMRVGLLLHSSPPPVSHLHPCPLCRRIATWR